ncbi:unnamed protein product [Rotaria sordida]|uniref:Hint domain-containing protein n=1 Tax=Rotaria sordida TaxID=392033 RepID=A0A815INI0_9BILA|nr:unnamed protein product [Rotaria sordida]
MYSKMNISYIILIGFIVLLYIDSSTSDHDDDHHDGGSKCFSGDSLIQLSNGEYKEIGNLQSGDEITTIDQSKIISTEMIMMLDKQISKQALFYTLRTDSGNEISLTEYHLIPIINSNGNEQYVFAKQIKIGDYLFVLFNGKLKYSPVINITIEMKKGRTDSGNEISLTEYHLIPIINSNGNEQYVFAKQIKIGDYLFVLFNGKLKYSPVINITIEMKKGYYAPLTMKGTLLVNNILASCFANAYNHHSAQYYMAPFRYYYKFARFTSLYDPFNVNKTEGLYWTINIMLHFARYFRSDTLCL